MKESKSFFITDGGFGWINLIYLLTWFIIRKFDLSLSISALTLCLIPAMANIFFAIHLFEITKKNWIVALYLIYTTITMGVISIYRFWDAPFLLSVCQVVGLVSMFCCTALPNANTYPITKSNKKMNMIGAFMLFIAITCIVHFFECI